MAIAIVLGFVLCWVPFSIIVLLVSFSWDACVVEHLLLIPSFMAHSNCIVNPYICFIFCLYYRRGLKKLVRSCGPMHARKTSPHANVLRH